MNWIFERLERSKELFRERQREYERENQEAVIEAFAQAESLSSGTQNQPPRAE